MRQKGKIMRYHRFVISMALAGLGGPLLASGAGAQAPGEKLVPLRVEMLTRAVSKLPFVIALDQGLFEKYGLDVDPWMPPPEFDAEGVEVEGRQPEEPEISIDGLTPMMNRVVTDASYPRRVALATTDCQVRWHIIGRKGITSLDQLKGKRLGISGYGSMSDFMARLFARRMGWDPVQDVSIMTNGFTIEALEEGRVDGLLAHERHYAQALPKGLPVLADTKDWGEFIGGNSVRVEAEWLKVPKNRDTALRFLKATVEAIAVFHRKPDVALKVLAKWHGITDPEFARIVYERGQTIQRKPYPCYAGAKTTMELFDSNEMRRYRVEDFYDDSLMRELDESGFIDSLYQ
jgi:NitT/TauT family transport system substrate-binding protein